MTEDRIAALERRLQLLEDEREITRLVTAYGPFVDAGCADEVAALWDEDGVYDVDEIHLAGREELAAMVRSKGHQRFLTGGCAHFLGPAHVTVDGDSAIAVCHSLLVVHGDDGFRVRRATAHHFTFDRGADGWRTGTRTSRVLDGRAEARDLLAAGVRGEPTPASRPPA